MKPCGTLLQRDAASVAQAQKTEARQNLQQAIDEERGTYGAAQAACDL